MGDIEAAWLSWRPPRVGETSPGRSRATAISLASSANVPCSAGGRVQTRKVKVALSPPTEGFPLSTPACCGRCCCLEAERRRLASSCLSPAHRGSEKKNRRNPPKSAVITLQPRAHRSTCPCVIKVEKQEGKKNLIKLAPQWLRRSGKRQLARRMKAVWRQVGIPAGADGASPSKTTPMVSARGDACSLRVCKCEAPGGFRPQTGG